MDAGERAASAPSTTALREYIVITLAQAR